MNKAWAALALGAGLALGGAAEAGRKSKAECVGEGACRKVEPLMIKVAGQKKPVPVYIEPTGPWVKDWKLTIHPGEAVTVRLDETDKGLVPVFVRGEQGEAAPTPLNPRELRLRLSRPLDGVTTVQIESAMPADLRFRLEATPLFASGRPVPTCSVAPMQGATVAVPWVALALELSDLRIVEQPVCDQAFAAANQPG